MQNFTRRCFLDMSSGFGAALCASGTAALLPRSVGAEPKRSGSAERWMDQFISQHSSRTEAAVGVLFVGRFRDPMYFLTSPISWHPDSGQAGYLAPIEVPAGFVTDLASIPRIFWSILRPDGEYAHAAVIHDYLYWTQSRPRDVADEILKRDMQDLHVDRNSIAEIYAAVRAFGSGAWEDNATLKASGEKRILKVYPNDPSILWSDWKKRPDVFA
jgi:hypothetical protein